MDDAVSICAANPLFENIRRQDIPALLECLQAVQRTYKKGALLFCTGQKVTQLGIVLSGRISIESSDFLGSRSIISTMGPGQLFCDAYSSTGSQTLLVDIAAQTDCTVLYIDTRHMLHVCGTEERYRDQLLENFVRVLAQKFVDLGCKVIHLSGRTTRRKLLSYLSEQYRLADGQPFVIPFTLQELADYLFVDRSGLSTELNRLLREGVLVRRSGRYTLCAAGRE